MIISRFIPSIKLTHSFSLILGLIPLSIPAASMTQALDAVSNAGEPLLGATVRLQLHGSGLENAIAQLQVRIFFK